MFYLSNEGKEKLVLMTISIFPRRHRGVLDPWTFPSKRLASYSHTLPELK